MLEWLGIPENIDDYSGFVYLITNLKSNKKYVGKKTFWRYEKRSIKTRLTSKELLAREKLLKKYNDGEFKTKKAYLEALKKLKFSEKKRQNSLVRTTKKIKVQSDWKKYYGSSKELLEDLELLGENNFKREVLWLCTGKWWESYLELKEQISRDAFFRDDYYNKILNVRLPPVVKESEFKRQKCVYCKER